MYHRRVFVFRRSRRRRDSAAHVVALLSSTRAPPLCVMTRTAFTSPVRRSVRKYRRAFYARRTVPSRDGESRFLIRRGPASRRLRARLVASPLVASPLVASPLVVSSRHVSSPSSASGGGGAAKTSDAFVPPNPKLLDITARIPSLFVFTSGA